MGMNKLLQRGSLKPIEVKEQDFVPYYSAIAK
jgi:hypothetical protein